MRPQAITLYALTALFVMCGPVHARATSGPDCVSDAHHPVVVRCHLAEQEVIVIAGSDHHVTCDTPEDTIVVTVGDRNSVSC